MSQTIDTAAVPAIGDNFAGSQEDLLQHARNIAKQAFLDLAASDKKGMDGTAGQRAAASVHYQYEAFKLGTPKPRTLVDYLTDSKARDDLTKLYVMHLIGVMPTNPRGDAAKQPGAKVHPANVLHDLQTEWRRKRALVVRGLELYSVLLKGSIGIDNFNETSGYWTVTRQLFCKAGFKVMGDQTTTQLNGKAFFATKPVQGKNEQLDKINASVTRLLQAHRNPPQRDNQAGQSATTGGTPMSQADKAGFDANVAALHAILSKRNSDKSWQPRMSDFGAKVWNQLTDIAKLVNDWSSNESFFLKAKAAPKQEEKAAA